MASRSQIFPRAVSTIRRRASSPDHVRVEQVLGLRMERRVDRDDVADLDQLLRRRVPGDAELPLDSAGKPVAVQVVQPHLERLQPTEQGEPIRPAPTVPTCMPSRS